jgi:hypothetical protein
VGVGETDAHGSYEGHSLQEKSPHNTQYEVTLAMVHPPSR